LVRRRVAGERDVGLAMRLRGHQDAAAESLRETPAQRGDVILVRVRDDDRVEGGDVVARQRRVVVARADGAGLDAGIEQQAITARLDAEAGAALLAETAVKREAHRYPSAAAGITQPSSTATVTREPSA